MKTIHGKYMKETEIKHYDVIGRPINVGDFVAVTIYNKLQIGQVIKLNPKMVKVKLLNVKTSNWYSGEHNRYPSDMALLDGEYLTFYLLKNSV